MDKGQRRDQPAQRRLLRQHHDRLGCRQRRRHLQEHRRGARWTAQTSGVTDNLNSVWFLDADTAWIVGKMGAAGPRVPKTVNGGTTWTMPPNSDSSLMRDWYAVSGQSNNVFVTGINGASM